MILDVRPTAPNLIFTFPIEKSENDQILAEKGEEKGGKERKKGERRRKERGEEEREEAILERTQPQIEIINRKREHKHIRKKVRNDSSSSSVFCFPM